MTSKKKIKSDKDDKESTTIALSDFTPDFNIKKIKEKTRGYTIYHMKGSDVNHATINCIKRTIMEEIPIYALSKSSIFVEENTTVFFNDQIQERLSMIPLSGLKSKIPFLESTYYPYVPGAYGTRLPPKETTKHPDDKEDIHIHLNVKNDTQDMLTVTTKDCKILSGGEEIDNIYAKSSYIVKLKKGEEIKVHAIPVLGVRKLHDCWSSIVNCYQNEITLNEYNLFIKSTGQFTENELLKKACEIINIKINKIRDHVKKLPYDAFNESDFLLLKLNNETHTMGVLLQSLLQKHKKIKFAAYKKPHMLVNEIVIGITTHEIINPIKILLEVLDETTVLYSQIFKTLS